MNDPIVAAQVKRATWPGGRHCLPAPTGRRSCAWVALQASQLADPRHGALILGEPDTGPFEVAAATPPAAVPAGFLQPGG